MASNPRFFKAIFAHTIQNGSLKIPPAFVKKHGNRLSDCACLQVSTGSSWKVELKRCDGRVWFHKGWQELVDFYSIKSGYFLVFRYDGGPFFHVFIFDPSTAEIEYPVSVASTSHRVGSYQPRIIEIEDDDDSDGDNDDDECNGVFLRTRQHSRSINKNLRGDQRIRDCEDNEDTSPRISEGRPRKLHKGEDVPSDNTNAREGVLQRAKAFKSTNPCFIVSMKPSFVSAKACLSVPSSHARRFFCGGGQNGIYLDTIDGRRWLVKYNISGPPDYRARVCSGWKKFVEGNHLRAGDVCAFELVEPSTVAYGVIIFRIADEERNDKSDHATSRAKDRILQRAKAFKSKNPHFMICMSPTYIRNYMNFPIAHARRCLMDKGQGETALVLQGSSGGTWPVHCIVRTSDRKYARLGHGWADFGLDNRLQVGDLCVFELINTTTMTYKVTIFRMADFA